MSNSEGRFSKITKYSDLFVIISVIGIVVMMIVPLHPDLLSLLLVFNISFALTVLMVAMNTKEPLQFSIFPSLLLLTTLLRLSLNVSSTRLILLEADAGQVIEQFGQFVVGGNPLVGFVIFLILVIIQFIVITKGAERVSEVAARFTLDAMPGKQMSIDADLNAGLITDEDARQRRKDIQREADFYGAMDGASKFVKGDAIAGLVITVINIGAGLAIGMLQHDMTAGESMYRFTLLTVGDGLVTQIPALLISTATGIVVTRAASDANLGHDVVRQLFNNPQALFTVTGVLLLLGLVPGLPIFPFFTLAFIIGFIGFNVRQANLKTEEEEIDTSEEEEIEESRKPENVMDLLHVDPIELELGYGLIPLVDTEQGGDLLDRVVMIRRQFAMEMGLLVPPIRMRDNMQLKPNTYVIKIRGVEISNGELLLDSYLAMGSGLEGDNVDGIDTTEPAFGLPAKWISENVREEAEIQGFTVVDPPSVLATHLTEVIRNYAYELLSREDVQSLIEHVKETNPTVVNELIPDAMTVGEVQKVLANLLREKVTIRDMSTILETLADYAIKTKDIDILTEYTRQAIARHIVLPHVTDGVLNVITLSPDIEQDLKNNYQQTEQGSYIALDPGRSQDIMENLGQLIEQANQQGLTPIVVCPPIIRFYFKKMTERMYPNLVVLSYNELELDVNIQSIGMVT
ncbi:flagellar biosynthesis protein FlhA [Desulfitispora alkaliphila]|uniref:flagellar biosynthesis protein FlhA n=1 Tax=Desulfitispora alkaliphila TaxID=622674 RepID=UPI003D24927E